MVDGAPEPIWLLLLLLVEVELEPRRRSFKEVDDLRRDVNESALVESDRGVCEEGDDDDVEFAVACFRLPADDEDCARTRELRS